LTHFNYWDSEWFDSSCNAFERSECLCCNQNILFCDVVFILIFFTFLYLSAFALIWFIFIDDFFFHFIFNINHAVYHWRDEEHLALIWFIFVNDFFSSFIFDVNHAIYHRRDEEYSELWYEFLISFILLIQ